MFHSYFATQLAFYSHVRMFSFFFCFSDHIFVLRILGSLNSFRLLMVTIFNLPAHPLCSPVGVLQMGACSCLIYHLQKVAEWRFLTSFNMPVCRHAGNSLLSHMFRNTHKHTQLPVQSSDKIRVWYDLTETPHTLSPKQALVSVESCNTSTNHVRAFTVSSRLELQLRTLICHCSEKQTSPVVLQHQIIKHGINSLSNG